MLTKDELIAPLAALRKDAVVVTTMGMVRPWGKHSNNDLDFASADAAMGHAADLALGIALAQPQRKVICLNGDGSMLMTLGTLVTAAQADAANFVLFVIENGTYEITGNQPVPGTGFVDFVAIGRGAGFRHTAAFNDPATYKAELPALLERRGPTLVTVRVEPGNETALSRGEREEVGYLKVSLAESAHQLREALKRA